MMMNSSVHHPRPRRLCGAHGFPVPASVRLSSFASFLTVFWFLAACLLAVPAHAGQAPQPQRAGIGYVYPAGGQQGKTFQVTLGGQYLDGVNAAFVSGDGVQAKIIELKVLPNSQELLLREQRDQLRDIKDKRPDQKQLLAAIEKKMSSYQRNPASVAIGQQVVVEVTIAPDAKTGEREIRLAAQRGLSNPLSFFVGYLPEYSAPTAVVSPRQILGREEESLRTRKLHDEINVKLPCVVNGQISSGAVDRYRFQARKGQKLVISAMAKLLVPYIADAVPGWFQAVMALDDAKGEQVAFNDDYKFKPDPVIFYEVRKDGEYTLTIYDSIYRGREDFVYRITMGEVPFITSIFPLGGPADGKTEVELKGWNLPFASLTVDNQDKAPGVRPFLTRAGARISNAVPFAVDALPECLETEPNNKPAEAQKVTLPVIINGRIDRPDDWDVFQFQGHSGEAIVAEVYARRLDSPLDSVLKLTDSAGNQFAFNDDHEDKSAGLNTHDADSYLTATLPADGTYFVHIGDTEHKGGEDYAYRLRISGPQPDFALRVVPASVSIANRGSVPLSVFVFRRDGFDAKINLELKNPPKGFALSPAVLSEKDESVQVTLKSTDAAGTKEPVSLHLIGSAKVGGKELVREAVPAEDRTQAFAYHHLVPAADWQAFIYAPPVPPALPPRLAAAAAAAQAQAQAASTSAKTTAPAAGTGTAKPAETASAKTTATAPGTGTAKPAETAPKKLTKDQIVRTYRDLSELLSTGLVTREFYDRKISEMEASGTPLTPPTGSDVSTSKAPSVGDGSSTIVYVTDTGGKYHREGCPQLGGSPKQMTLKAAVVAHRPCPACKPPVLDGSPVSTTTPAKSASPDKDASPFPKSGPMVKKVFFLRDGRIIRAVLITESDTAYVLKDVQMKLHEVAKDDVVRIQDP